MHKNKKQGKENTHAALTDDRMRYTHAGFGTLDCSIL